MTIRERIAWTVALGCAVIATVAIGEGVLLRGQADAVAERTRATRVACAVILPALDSIRARIGGPDAIHARTEDGP